VDAAGFSLITLPEGTVALLDVVTVPSVRLAPVIEVVAAACVSPTTLGTDTCAGPLLTVRATAEPGATLVVAAGFSLITLPEATLALLAIVTAPTFRPTPVIDVVAVACVTPTTLGTATLAGLGLSELPQLAINQVPRIVAAIRCHCTIWIELTTTPYISPGIGKKTRLKSPRATASRDIHTHDIDS
jgi:hypothetical protein